jgi:Asp-tRNA(Asn)/Glu-tRNA(Gln) amidotransferase A subunit family amidase
VFNAPSSMLFAPAVTVPLMAFEGMPVGVQVMGQHQQDARVTPLAVAAGQCAAGVGALASLALRRHH